MAKATLTAALVLAGLAMGTLGSAGCSTPRTGDGLEHAVGSVGLAISLPSGTTLSVVKYSIRNETGLEVSTGNIDTSDPNATVSLVVGGIAAGPGYVIELVGMTSDGGSCVGLSAPFAVVANQTVAVMVLLRCQGAGRSVANIMGMIDNCPVITSYFAAPLAAAGGGVIDVSAAASDTDPGDTVTLRWSATAGTFDAANSAATRYHCPVTSGQQTLTITASDGIDPGSNLPKCTTPVNIVVNCGLCGNGIVDTGEQCDPPNGTTCDSNCRSVDDGGFCGDGIVQPGEQCDPPNRSTCSSVCQTIPGECGDSVVQPGEQCDPPGPIIGSIDVVCSPTCEIMPSGALAACKQCEDTGASSSTGTRCAANQRCDSLTDPNLLAQCNAAVMCMRSTHCAVGGDNSLCYCSRAVQEGGQCANGMPDGPCAAIFEANDPNVVAGMTASERANTVLSDLSDPTSPIGLSGRQIGLCDQVKCAVPCAGLF